MCFRARHYSPRFGRFIQRDPLYPASDHYTYASNNPARFIDPLGLYPLETEPTDDYPSGDRENIGNPAEVRYFAGLINKVESGRGDAFEREMYASLTPEQIKAYRRAQYSDTWREKAKGIRNLKTINDTSEEPFKGEKEGYLAIKYAFLKFTPILLQGATAGFRAPANPQAAIKSLEAAARVSAPSLVLTGFSVQEASMASRSIKALRDAGYDVTLIRYLIRADLPRGYRAMSIKAGAALGREAFSSQSMLNHVLEEELLHLQQKGSGLFEEVARGTVKALEEAVNVARKFPLPASGQ